MMKASYKKLWKLLVDKEMSKSDLHKATGLSSSTMTNSAAVRMFLWKLSAKFALCSIAILQISLSLKKEIIKKIGDKQY